MALNYHEWSAQTHTRAHSILWIIIFVVCSHRFFLSVLFCFVFHSIKTLETDVVWWLFRKMRWKKTNSSNKGTDKLTTSQLIFKRFSHLASTPLMVRSFFCLPKTLCLNMAMISYPFVTYTHFNEFISFWLEKTLHTRNAECVCVFLRVKPNGKNSDINIQSEFKL